MYFLAVPNLRTVGPIIIILSPEDSNSLNALKQPTRLLIQQSTKIKFNKKITKPKKGLDELANMMY